ncbi:hypothetical protein SARC_05158 [Sphaeroforma arctica JP610]|uniref:Uncharacterized protein n=1 Tax=Sphaeroforma arctica JP610 TaxID=667725 RepID=A0A0L0G0F1_9EUKA|nr:hypothetical protein SARC_05158 [Sphaeroforma arctica JP610]KNC82562.1 hypothetical protein SARC_05158 [Sphaeroforma arctica JP610]|eukprot:XP_014156464.1 hypothetical protein SARC_05158 [Sphaeroforma arctica JP610]
MSSKLTLLTSHFTSLRLIWSRSPHMSAEVIRSLKTGHAQPDPATCMAKRSAIEDEINTTHTAATAPGFNNGTTAYNSSNTGYNGSGGTTNTGYYNQQAKQLLLKMPGITSRNVKYVMDNVASVYELSQMNLKEVQTLLGQAAGKQLHDFVNQGL